MRLFWMGVAVSMGLSGCGQMPSVGGMFGGKAEPEVEAAPVVVAEDVAPEAEAEIEVAAAEPVAPPAPRPSNKVIAALGDPADPGLWVKTALVSVNTPGTVTTDSGKRLAVTLRPLADGADGAAQLSLMAMQELGVGLAALVPLTISVGG